MKKKVILDTLCREKNLAPLLGGKKNPASPILGVKNLAHLKTSVPQDSNSVASRTKAYENPHKSEASQM